MIYKPVMVMQGERVRTQLISLEEGEKQQFMMAESSYKMQVKKRYFSERREVNFCKNRGK